MDTTTETAVETIVVLGPNYWGKGTTLAEAKANLRKQGGRLSWGYLILTFPPETEFKGVDDFGRYHYSTRDGSPNPTPPTERLVKGTATA